MDNMEGIGAEVSQKIRSAIKAKLTEIGVYVDEELPDYVMVMVGNKRSKEQMDEDLQLFLGKHTSLFTTWLHQVLQKLQEVTIANLGGAKRKLSEESKKKKKSKQDIDKKALKKKIKIEPEESSKDSEKETEHRSGGNDQNKHNVTEEASESFSSNQLEETVEAKKKKKTDLKAQENDTNSISDSNNDPEIQLLINPENPNLQEREPRVSRSKSHSTSSQPEDLDDEDCINIRTDGELLDTTEDVHTEEPSSKHKEKKEVSSSKKNRTDGEKKRTTFRKSPVRHQTKTIPPDDDERVSQNEEPNRHPSPHKSPPKSNDKIVDARELLNRRKAAKQSENRVRSRSRDGSSSPPRKRREDNRHYRDEKDANRRTDRESDREPDNRRVSRDDKRDRRGVRDRDFYSSKGRGGDRSLRRQDQDRQDSRDGRRRDSSNEPPSKRVMLDRPFRNRNDNREQGRSSNVRSGSEGRKVEFEPSVKRRDTEELVKRGGLVSRVVARAVEPEDDVDTPMPSVVKVTPRPRRPPSQQPSSTLIMRAISEANKSLANVSQRPDSTQRTRKEPVFTRTLRQLQRIPPEKIAVSITNPMALQNVEKHKDEEKINRPLSQHEEEMDNVEAPLKEPMVSSLEPDNPVPKNEDGKHKELENEKLEKEPQKEEEEETEIEVEVPTEVETFEEPMEEMSDPQFVVTLNGYDPDNLYSQSELDLGEDCDNDDWIKDQEPLLTSTPDEAESPRPKRDRNMSPIVIMNTPAINHSNLIEVELVKPKSTERCKYWPACRLGETCTYYHPTKTCKSFPACKFGDSCLYIHPQCKFNALCTRKDCVFAHTAAHTPSQPAATMPKAKTLYAAAAPLPCKFYPNCANINCQFAHPPRACRFGLYCTKKDCSFDHGQVAPVDKLKWTRVPTT